MLSVRLRYGSHLEARDWIGYLRLLGATALLCGAVGLGQALAPLPPRASVGGAIHLFALIGLGGLAYLAGLYAFAAPEFALVRGLLRRIAGRLRRP
jgi:hypothetical protein